MKNEDIEYIIQGTLEEIEDALINDFDLSEEEARFCLYYEIEKKQRSLGNEYFTPEEIRLWYMQDKEPNTFQIFNKPYSITITDVESNFTKALQVFLIKYLITQQMSIFDIGMDIIFLIADSIKKIEKDDYCIYGRIVEKTFKENEEFFSAENIRPYTEVQGTYIHSDHKCDRRPEDWICPYHQQDDSCTIDVDLCLKHLEKQGIIKQVPANNDLWRIVR